MNATRDPVTSKIMLWRCSETGYRLLAASFEGFVYLGDEISQYQQSCVTL